MKTYQFNDLFEKDADGHIINKVAIDIPGQFRAAAGTQFTGRLSDEAEIIAALSGRPIRVEIVDEEGEPVYRIVGDE